MTAERDAILEANRHYGLRWGQVTFNDDPEKLGRVKINIPGITTNDSDWAWPVGMPGAGADHQGAYVIPRVGSTVLVGFIQGDVDEPVYFTGPWRLDSQALAATPRKPQEKDKTNAPNVRVLAQTDNFEVYISDMEAEQRLVLQGLDEENTISINLRDGSIRLTASHYLILEAPMISINASGQLNLQGRRVGSLGPKI